MEAAMTCVRCSVAQDVQLCPFCNLALCPRCLDRHHCTGKGS